MKDEYLIWSRGLEAAEREKHQAEIMILMNDEMIKICKEKLKKLPKPKLQALKKLEQGKPVGIG